MEMTEETCPVCKSDRYLNPNMQLLVSPCYHRVCSTCVERLFAHGSAPCPVCGTLLRRSNFVIPSFEDLYVERECRIRLRLAEIFNRREEDFETLRDYNDYLEEVEGIVWRLVEERDVQKTNEQLEAYRQQNLDLIMRNRRLQEEEARRLQEERLIEEQQRVDYESQLLAELEEEEKTKRREEESLMEELARSNESAVSLVKRAVGKRRAQADVGMPSLRGLKVQGRMEAPPPIDPFETLPPITLKIEMPKLEGFPCWFFGSRTPDVQVIRAGGLLPHHVYSQVLLAMTCQ